MTSLHGQQRRASAPYFESRVRVGMGFVPTVDAREDRLALAARAIHDTAGLTGLRGVRGGDVNQPAPCGFEFVIEQALEDAPPLGQNGAVQAGFLPRSDTAPSAGHLSDLQVFDCYDAKSLGDVGTGDVKVMGADTSDLRRDLAQFRTLPRVSPRSPSAASQDPLDPAFPTVNRDEAGQLDVLSCREADRVCDTPVNANGWKIVGRQISPLGRATEHHLPTTAGSTEGRVSAVSRNCSRGTETNPAKRGEAYLGPLRVQRPHLNITALNAERIVIAKPAEPGIAGALEERAIGSVKVAQRLFKGRAWNGADPIDLLAEGGDLKGLACPPERPPLHSLEVAPVIATLLQSEIVHQSHDTHPLAERLGLCGRRVEIEPVSAKHLAQLSTNGVPAHAAIASAAGRSAPTPTEAGGRG